MMPYEDRWTKIMVLAGVVGAAFFAVVWTAAVIVDGHWTFGEETLSALGGDRPGAAIFNAGVIIEGLLGLLFSVGFYRLNDGLMHRTGATVLALSTLALIAVGIFPVTAGAVHDIASYAFFGLALLALLLLILPLKNQEYFGNIGAGLTAALVIVSLSFLFTSPIPLTEAVAVICLLLWLSSIALMVLGHQLLRAE